MNIPQRNFLTKYFIIAVLALGSSPAFAQVSISVDIAPPPLQVYTQPACPDDGYLWTPGYWAYDNNAYYWVPGAWVQPPQVGEYWTPPYWGWDGSAYVFYPGYWGPSVGFYGGVNYGYGYGGNGYGGGRWQGGHFFYNTAVNNVSSANFHNTYVDRSVIHGSSSHVSYNGGKGGLQVQPTAKQRQARHLQPASQQQLTSAKSDTEVSPHPVIKAETQAPSESQDTHPSESHETAVKPQDKPEATPQTHSAPSDTQSHSGPPSDTQSHSGPPAETQSHSGPPAETQSHSGPPANSQSHSGPSASTQSHSDAQSNQSDSHQPDSH